MAYDDPRYGTESSFRGEPEFGPVGDFAAGTKGDQAGYGAPYDYTERSRETTRSTGSRRHGTGSGSRQRAGAHFSGAHLDDVFDDPEHGEPGRDRMAVHIGWELALLIGVVAAAFLLRQTAPGDLRAAGLKELLLLATTIGLATVGMGLSLRAGVVNLAIGPVGYASALFFAQHSDRGLTTTAITTAGVAIMAGAVLAVVVVGLHVPAWAASLGLALAAIAWIQRYHAVAEVVNGAYQPRTHAYFWFAVFAVLAVLGGLLGLVKSVRRGLSRFRPVVDPANRRGVAAAAPAVAALIGSTGFAAAAGVLLALTAGKVDPAETGLTLTGLALGAALLGGTSAFGRRGGVLGTLLAVVLVVGVQRLSIAKGWPLTEVGIAAAAIGVGLVVTRLVERFGRPPVLVGVAEPVEAAPPAWTAPPAGDHLDSAADSAWSSRSGGWASPLSARTTEQGWGEAERWPGR